MENEKNMKCLLKNLVEHSEIGYQNALKSNDAELVSRKCFQHDLYCALAYVAGVELTELGDKIIAEMFVDVWKSLGLMEA